MLPAYSPKDVKIVLGISGFSSAITGLAPDAFVTVKRNSPLISERVGLSGEVMTSNVKDRTGEISINLMQTSLSNITLSKLVIDMEDKNTVPVLNLVIQDPSGSILVEAINVYFKRVPTVTVGATQSNKTWVFGCEDLRYSGEPAGYTGDDGLVGIIVPPLPF